LRPLIVYLNERSLCANATVGAGEYELKAAADQLWRGLRVARRERRELSLAVTSADWHAQLLNLPFSVQMRRWLGADRYTQLLGILRHSEHTLASIEVAHSGTVSAGLTLALIANSWAISLVRAMSPWAGTTIRARRFELLDNGNAAEEDCDVRNIGTEAHGVYWTETIQGWGQAEAANNELALVAEHVVEMYPLDHGYPHVHLVSRNPPGRTVAKYRVDVFSRLEGLPDFDNAMRNWIEEHREALLQSWLRCQKGQHPYRL